MTTPIGCRRFSSAPAARAAARAVAPVIRNPRRDNRMRSPHSQCLQFAVPRLAIGSSEPAGRLGVADDLLARRIPPNHAFEAEGDVREMADRGDPMRAFQIGDRLLAALDAIEE